MTHAQPELPGAPRAHDLPVKWDGHRVEWRGWEVQPPSTMRFHLRPDCCRWCGSIAEPLLNWGRVFSEPGAVLYRRAKSYAEAVANQATRREGRCLGSLMAFRCPDCRHDYVVDNLGAGAVCDLDDSDYGDDGSWLK